MTNEQDSEFTHHEPCPKCDSSDALAVYDDGHGHCFSCGHHADVASGSSTGGTTNSIRGAGRDTALLTGSVEELPTRALTKSTCRKFGYEIGKDKAGARVHIANYFNEEGELKCQKVRWKDKKFMFLGDTKNPPLYGMHLWKRGGNKIVITEGEIDALSVSQCQDNKWPVVSLPNGAQAAKKSLKQHLEYLESFKEIILMFDNDEAGQAAVETAVNLFTPSKVKVAKLEGGKDANECLQKKLFTNIISAIWQARGYQPDGVYNAADLKDRVNKPVEWGLSFPWEDLTNITYGIRPKEIYTFGAGTGMGKTESFKEIATHLMMHHEESVGMLFLEEAPEDTTIGIMGKHASIPFHIPDSEYTQEQKDDAFDAVTSTNRLWVYDSFGYTDYDIIKSRIRYLVVSCGCKFIFLDHITALVSSGEVVDERRELDSIMTSLASLVRELDFTLFLISHLATPEGKPHEEGGRVMIKHFRGSRAIGQWSSFMFGLERNQQSDDVEEANTTTLRCLKDRFSGRGTGKTVQFGYNGETGRLFVKEFNPFDDAVEGNTKEEF